MFTTHPRSGHGWVVALAAGVLTGTALRAQRPASVAAIPSSSGVEITAAIQQAAFRDFAASPIVYQGTGGTLLFGDSKRRPASRFASDPRTA